MSLVDTQRLLMEMRQVAQQAQMGATPPVGGVGSAADVAGGDAGVNTDFAGIMRSALDKVNNESQLANQMKEKLELGESDVELSEVMVQAQKASLAFQAMTQVRNKLVEAYKDVMNMPI